MKMALLDLTSKRQRPVVEGTAPVRTIDASHPLAAHGATLSQVPSMRPLRFVIVGGVATATQLVALTLLVRLGWNELLANGVALAFSTQVNFAFSAIFTWRDSWDMISATGRFSRARLVGARWMRFMGAISGTLALNEAVYGVARRVLQPVLAAVLVSGGIAIVNFLLSDHFVFVRARSAQGIAAGTDAPALTPSGAVPEPVSTRKESAR